MVVVDGDVTNSVVLVVVSFGRVVVVARRGAIVGGRLTVTGGAIVVGLGGAVNATRSLAGTALLI